MRRWLAIGIAVLLAAGIWAAAKPWWHSDTSADVVVNPALPAVSALPPGPAPRWAVDPNDTGPNLPKAGRSLFDFVVLQPVDGTLVYDVPFPFDALVRRIAERAGCVGAPESCVRQILIPLGRSLQRSAATPDFFAFPRVVIAVDREGPDATALPLKDRLYVGYQEKSDLLEVISYNEAAGRFEFQLVQDYRPGGTPRLVYATRSVCTACHQNHAPLFARQQWDETNANPRVAKLLADGAHHVYGFGAHQSIEVPNAIDAAVHRANLLPVSQALWLDGCGSEAPHSTRCRAAALVAALQYRLSGERAFDAGAAAFNSELVATLAKTAASRWPHGLALPNPEIPNRDPFGFRTGATGLSMVDVPARLEPLLPRAPLEVWPSDAAQIATRMVAGLSRVFSDADMRWLDHELARMAAAKPPPSKRLGCTGDVSRAGTEVRFHCRAAANLGVDLDGRALLRGARVESGEITALRVGGEPPLRLLGIADGRIEQDAAGSFLVLKPAAGGWRARLASGNVVDRIELRWQGAATGQVVIVEDFVPVQQAIAADHAQSPAGAQPFARAPIMAAIAGALQAPQRTWCCAEAAGFPEPQEDVEPPPGNNLSEVAEKFLRSCAACHRTPQRSPPNFLHGDARRIDASLAACAPRIFVRLSMWRVAPEERAKTPMPPPRAAHDGMPVGYEYGPKPVTLDALRDAVASMLQHETGAAPTLAALLADGYESLRPCLPPSN